MPKRALDLNALSEEHLQLAYQGQLIKDPGFTAVLHTEMAPGLRPVAGARADLERVLLNLFANDFYAGCQRQQAGESEYVPMGAAGTIARVGRFRRKPGQRMPLVS